MSDEPEHSEVEQQDLFEARYMGTLSEAEQRAFDLRLEQDQDLADRYAAFVNVMHVLQPAERLGSAQVQALRERLREVDEELDATEKNRPSRWYWAAAAVVLLVGGTVWWNMGRDEHLADAYELPEPGLPVLMSTGQSRFDGLMNAYKQANWPEAEQAIRSLLQTDPRNDTVLYFQAIVLSRTERCADAIPLLDALPAASTYRERALYHAAICHLRLGDRTAARKAMQAMEPVQDPQIAGRVRSLLDRL